MSPRTGGKIKKTKTQQTTKPNPKQLQLSSSTWVDLIRWITQSVCPVQPTIMDPNLFETHWHLQKNPHPSASKETICLANTLSYNVPHYKEVAISRQWSINSWSEAKRTPSAGSLCDPYKTIIPDHMGLASAFTTKGLEMGGCTHTCKCRVHKKVL